LQTCINSEVNQTAMYSNTNIKACYI